MAIFLVLNLAILGVQLYFVYRTYKSAQNAPNFLTRDAYIYLRKHESDPPPEIKFERKILRQRMAEDPDFKLDHNVSFPNILEDTYFYVLKKEEDGSYSIPPDDEHYYKDKDGKQVRYFVNKERD